MADKFLSPYDRVTALHPSAPVEVGECGTVNVDPTHASSTKASWFMNMFTTTALPRLETVNYFGVDQTSSGGNDWRIDSTNEARDVWRRYLPLTRRPLVRGGQEGIAKTSTLLDGFTRDSGLWNGYGYSLGGGAVSIPAGSSYPEMKSILDYDLTDSQIHVQVPVVPNLGAGSTRAGLAVIVDANSRLEIAWEGGTLSLKEVVAGVESATRLPYDSRMDHWWRLRHAGGVLYWETSHDKISWSIRRTKTTSLSLTRVKVRLNAGNYGGEVSPGSAIFDGLNL